MSGRRARPRSSGGTRLGDGVVFAAFRTLCWVAGILPPTRAYRFFRGLGGWIYRRDRKHQKIGLLNLRIAFPEADDRWREEVLAESYRVLGQHFVDIARLWREGPETLRSRVTYEPHRGIENYQAARGQSGVLFVTAHVSSWELLPQAHAAHTRPLHFVVRPLDNPLLDRWTVHLRERFGNRVIPKQGALRRMLRLLRGGEDVGILIDQNVQAKDAVFVRLFGHPASATPAAAALALKTGCPVIPAFLLPAKTLGHYRIRFYPPIRVTHSEDHGADLARWTQVFTGYIEEVVREFPACWLWGHRRFLTQPDGRNPYEQLGNLS
ncbi:MAG: lipid A biosynthesis lauroyl acyltransferase [Acidobacteriota bacterium]